MQYTTLLKALSLLPMTRFAHDTVVPYEGSAQSKKEQVEDMFNCIAGRYDLLNRFLSFGIDKGWRKKALLKLKAKNPQQILDVATGTADVAIMASELLQPKKITGIDLSEGMLQIGRQKIERLGLQQQVELLKGDSETILFPDNSFDAVTVAFGVRNFQNLEQGLSEILRVLKPNGQLVVLEFSKPSTKLMGALYNLYMRFIAPGVSSIFSANAGAYEYLGESIRKFPEGNHFVNILQQTGYKNTAHKPLSFGICSIYCGEK